MLLWDESFFNNYVSDLNEEPPAEYSYGTIYLNVETPADIGFESQVSYAQQNDYGFVYCDSKQSNPEATYEEKPADSHIDWETNQARTHRGLVYLIQPICPPTGSLGWSFSRHLLLSSPGGRCLVGGRGASTKHRVLDLRTTHGDVDRAFCHASWYLLRAGDCYRGIYTWADTGRGWGDEGVVISDF
ncbi:hypothetical protein R6Q57_005723 [Mikania cordata]